MHDTQGQFNPLVHGTTGKIKVSLANFNWPVSSRVLRAAKELPDDFPFNLDPNSGTPLGVGKSTLSWLLRYKAIEFLPKHGSSQRSVKERGAALQLRISIRMSELGRTSISY